MFHSYDDVYVDFTKLSVQSSLKCLLGEMSENKNCHVVMQIIIQNHCTVKVTKSKKR